MNIKYEFSLEAIFKDEEGKRISNKSITEDFLFLNGRKGKVKLTSYPVYGHGFSGAETRAEFIYQEDLSSDVLVDGQILTKG